MCDCKRLSAHSLVDLSSADPTTSEVLQRWSPSRCPPSSLTRQTLRRRDVVQSLFTVVEVDLFMGEEIAVESSTDLFVASHWLERSSSRFSVTLLVFSRADHSTLQVLTTFYVVFISTFYWRLASKVSKLLRPFSDWSTAVMSQAAVNSDVFSIRSLLTIFEYAAKQVCKQLQCNKAKLSEPGLGLYIHRALSYASQNNNLLCTLDEIQVAYLHCYKCSYS